ncbi:hypothetical protein N8500_02760 [Candidatus Puniceispirillum sp.]|nr:hypothetical protein [Candidatus Puniceispirillum sp.]
MNKNSLFLSLMLHTAIGYSLFSLSTVRDDKSTRSAKLPIIEFVLEKNPLEKPSVLGMVTAKSRIGRKDLEISTRNNLNMNAKDITQSFSIKEVQLNKKLKTKKDDLLTSLSSEASTTKVIESIKRDVGLNKGKVIEVVKKTQEPNVRDTTNDIMLFDYLGSLDLKLLSRPLPLSKQNQNILLKQSLVPKTILMSNCNVLNTNMTNKKLNPNAISRILGSSHLTITSLIGSQQLQLKNGSKLNISQLLSAQKNYQIKATKKSFSVAQLLAMASRGQKQPELHCSD